MDKTWLIETLSGKSFTTDLLIAADGRRSVVAAQLNLTVIHKKKRIAFRCYLPTRYLNEHVIEMHLLPNNNYIGIDVVDDMLVNYSIVTNEEDYKAYTSPEAMIRAIYNQSPQLQKNIILPHPMPEIEAVSPVGHQVKDCIASHVALVGDAGGFIEPLTGDGMTIALWTASTLAKELITCRDRGQWARRQKYLGRYRQLKHRHYFQKILLTKLLYWSIRHAEVCDVLGAVIGHSQKRLQAFMGVINNSYTPLRGLAGVILGF
jgi:2-polyprenyl-6-methoxyphenol hydroxylase-like FAD-dependent oxidoreductase